MGFSTAQLSTEMACKDGVQGDCCCILTPDLHADAEEGHDHGHDIFVLREFRELGAHLREAASLCDFPLAR